MKKLKYEKPLLSVVAIPLKSLFCESSYESEFGGEGGGIPADAHLRIVDEDIDDCLDEQVFDDSLFYMEGW